MRGYYNGRGDQKQRSRSTDLSKNQKYTDLAYRLYNLATEVLNNPTERELHFAFSEAHTDAENLLRPLDGLGNGYQRFVSLMSLTLPHMKGVDLKKQAIKRWFTVSKACAHSGHQIPQEKYQKRGLKAGLAGLKKFFSFN